MPLRLSPVRDGSSRTELLRRGNLTGPRCVCWVVTSTAPDDHDGASWVELTARSAALCRRDRAIWRTCADRSDELEAQGVPALLAVQLALDECDR